MVARVLVLMGDLFSGCHAWLAQQCSSISAVCHCWLVQQCLFAQADPDEPLWQRLTPERKVKVFAALAALLILGGLMITITWLSARAMRRYMRGPRRLPTTGNADRPDEDWWKSRSSMIRWPPIRRSRLSDHPAIP